MRAPDAAALREWSKCGRAHGLDDHADAFG